MYRVDFLIDFENYLLLRELAWKKGLKVNALAKFVLYDYLSEESSEEETHG